MDALAEFLDTLLRKHSEDTNVLAGMNVAGAMINGGFNSNVQPASAMQNFDQYLNAEMTERRLILSELVSAVGLQRFRLHERVANGK